MTPLLCKRRQRLSRSHRRPYRKRPGRRPTSTILFLGWCALLGSLATLAIPRDDDQSVIGPVATILDGDTLRIGETTYRLWGIDAPDPDVTPQSAYFAAASAALRFASAAQPVRCTPTGGTSYGRLTARCHNHRGEDLAAALVQAGYAVDWPRYSQGHYAAAERAARRQRLGLWTHLDHSWR